MSIISLIVGKAGPPKGDPPAASGEEENAKPARTSGFAPIRLCCYFLSLQRGSFGVFLQSTGVSG